MQPQKHEHLESMGIKSDCAYYLGMDRRKKKELSLLTPEWSGQSEDPLAFSNQLPLNHAVCWQVTPFD